MSIAENIAVIREKIAAACAASGRSVEEITLVGASKMNEAAAFREAIAAGIDVLCEEPPRKGSPLLSARNCFVTPHIAWATIEARTRLLKICENNLRAFINGHPQNVVS